MQCLCIAYCQNFVRGDVILKVTVLLNYNSKQFITLINISGDVKLWVRVTPESTNIDAPWTMMIDSSVIVCHFILTFRILYPQSVEPGSGTVVWPAGLYPQGTRLVLWDSAPTLHWQPYRRSTSCQFLSYKVIENIDLVNLFTMTVWLKSYLNYLYITCCYMARI